ncbi:MAG: hypothetical protein AMJ38_01635 [Dehalococcoidia bacterium DG_22]|nr:MAG: hypothetical protein AMJ38_01635 [Dehalococcoidia bacterium DG_22]
MPADAYDEELRPDMTLQQPAALEGPPRALLRLELITDGFHMVGSMELHRAGGRLVDFLNFSGEPVLVLHDAEVKALERESDKASHWPMAQIRREAIILAIPREDRPQAAEMQQPLEYAPREPRRVSFILPAFAVVGDLHLAKEVDINAASPIRGSDFVPLTDAEATYLPHPTLVWRAAVIVVNVAKAEVCCPAADLSPQQLF